MDTSYVSDISLLSEKTKRQLECEELRKGLQRIDDEFRLTRNSIASEQDKKLKHQLLCDAKARRDEKSSPITTRLSELESMHPDISREMTLPHIHHTKQYKTTMDQIKSLWNAKKSMPDPLMADLEIGKLLMSLGDEDKAVAYMTNAIRPFENTRNSMVEPTEEEMKVIKKSEDSRIYEAHYLLFHYFLKKKAWSRCEVHMSAYLAKSEGRKRIDALTYLEKILKKYCDIVEVGRTTPQRINDVVLGSKSLGILQDLRVKVLQELNTLYPNDPYYLESLGQQYVNLHEYDKAKSLLDEFVKLPGISNLPTFAQVLEYKPQPRSK
ncbi:unnamed protein product [Aphanomyces euteiches]